jgi:hypothetical protein
LRAQVLRHESREEREADHAQRARGRLRKHGEVFARECRENREEQDRAENPQLQGDVEKRVVGVGDRRMVHAFRRLREEGGFEKLAAEAMAEPRRVLPLLPSDGPQARAQVVFDARGQVRIVGIEALVLGDDGSDERERENDSGSRDDELEQGNGFNGPPHGLSARKDRCEKDDAK